MKQIIETPGNGFRANSKVKASTQMREDGRVASASIQKERKMTDMLSNAVQRTVTEWRKHPTSFLSERDIQAWLFVELRNAMSDVRNKYDGKGKTARFGFKGPFDIHPVTTEYHYYNRESSRFDVAVLSEEQDSESDLWRQPCRIGIEIKLWQPGYEDCEYQLDVAKLHSYQAYLQSKFGNHRAFTGIALTFVHPHVRARRLAALPSQVVGEPYPENGVALHLVTKAGHSWQQVSPQLAPVGA
jgi:hypothetical protein